jgi:microcystin-dependent protein
LNGNTNTGTASTPVAAVLAKIPVNGYGPPTQLVAMNAGASLPTGGSQAHLNMQPFLTLSFCIALQGIFPSPS